MFTKSKGERGFPRPPSQNLRTNRLRDRDADFPVELRSLARQTIHAVHDVEA